jgi:formylglycine-generating enzyme required for sulfatase activity
VIDPWLSLAGLWLLMAEGPSHAEDPGPSPACPDDMRLVAADHRANVGHLCTDVREGQKGLGANKTMEQRCWSFVEDLTLLEGATQPLRVCMDQFEAPNRRGAKPMVMQSFRTAVKWCQKRNKRLCSETEWQLACEGPRHLPWAYGWAVNVKLCNSNKRWKQVDFEAFHRSREDATAESDRLWQGTPSGHFATCTSPFGLFDMMGNVEEWVTLPEGSERPGALVGGFWSKPWSGCRGTNDAHEPEFAFYETGFRCCKDPK